MNPVPFKLEDYEVTQEQWQSVMGSNPSLYKCEECPVNNVSWNDIEAFIEKLLNPRPRYAEVTNVHVSL